MIKLAHGYMKLSPSDLVLFCGKAGVGKTTLICNEAKNASNFHKILFLSLESDKLTIEKHHFFKQENTIIADRPTTIEELKKYINDYQPEYVYIDYLELFDVKNGYQSKYINTKSKLDELKKIATEYNIGMMITSTMEKDKTMKQYLTSDYDACKSVWILTGDKLDRIR